MKRTLCICLICMFMVAPAFGESGKEPVAGVRQNLMGLYQVSDSRAGEEKTEEERVREIRELERKYLSSIASSEFVPEAPVSTSGEEPLVKDPYLIGCGDILHISIWKEDELTRDVTVLPDGTLSFPLIGGIKAAGKSVAALKQEIIRRIEGFVPDPVLSVEVARSNSFFVYILGKVRQPGRYHLNANINVLQALSLAGGLNPYAKEKEIRIIRNGDKGYATALFNYEKVAMEGDYTQNVMIHRGDTIVVP